MAPCLSHRSVQGLVWKTGSDFLSLERKIYLSFSLYLLLRLSLYLIEVYIIELQILQLSLLQILRQPLQILQRSLQILQRSLQLLQLVRMVYGGVVWGYVPSGCHNSSAITKRPRPVRESSQDQPGPCPP